MPRTHALELPEVLSAVARYLSRDNLAVCVRVSRLWHQSFLSHLWSNLRLEQRWYCPPFETIAENRHYVKTLYMEVDLVGKNNPARPLHFPNLKELSVRLPISSKLMTMFLRPSLTRLELLNASALSTTRFWKAVLELDDLKEFRADFLECDYDSMNLFWSVCARVECLSLNTLQVFHTRDLTAMTFPRIRELTLNSSGPPDLNIMRRCPNLESLIWTPSDPKAWRKCLQYVVDGLWPNLSDLQLMSNGPSDADLERALLAMKKIMSLQLDGFGPRCLRAVRPHFKTLKRLVLHDCKDPDKTMAQEILTHCPMLEELRGLRIDAEKIAQGYPWVCSNLRSLRIPIDFEPGTNERLQPLVIAQLLRLTKLETLCLDCPPVIDGRCQYNQYNLLVVPFQEALDLRLGKGLEKLSSLQWLRQFYFRHTLQRMGKEEVKWMIENWKQLKVIKGSFNDDPNDTMNLETLIRAHRINIFAY
ncbi:hypothetical protein BGZ98_007076 [Dissophora globulifera]|nr:hypothetical protein BGZ98_007076 [Dissophora globulifera]